MPNYVRCLILNSTFIILTSHAFPHLVDTFLFFFLVLLYLKNFLLQPKRFVCCQYIWISLTKKKFPKQPYLEKKTVGLHHLFACVGVHMCACLAWLAFHSEFRGKWELHGPLIIFNCWNLLINLYLLHIVP